MDLMWKNFHQEITHSAFKFFLAKMQLFILCSLNTASTSKIDRNKDQFYSFIENFFKF